MKYFFLIVLYLFIFFNCALLIAQNNVVTYFNKVYGGNDTMNMLSQIVKPVEDGYCIMGGYRTSTYRYLYVSKLDLQGNMLWIRNIDSINTVVNNPLSLGVLTNGSLAVQTNEASIVITYGKYQDIVTTKINTEGSVIWRRVIEKINEQVPNQIIPTIDGGFAIAGVTANAAQDSSWGYLLKLNYMGNFEWDRQYERGNSVTFFSVQQWWDGTYIMGGWGWNGTDYDMWVVKTYEQGDTLWTKALGGIYSDWGCTVSILTTWEDWYYNNAPVTYLVSGADVVDDMYSRKMYLAKLSENGNSLLWERLYSSPQLYNIASLQTMPIIYPDGSFLGISGYTSDGTDFPGEVFTAAVLMKFKSNGTVDWYKKLYPENTFAEAYIKDLQRTPDGGYVMAGYQYSPTPQKGWVLKMDADFNTCSFAGCDSTVYVGVGETPVLPLGDRFRVSPNPAQDMVTIEIPNFTAPVLLRIFDISGREVKQVWLPTAHATIPTQTLGTGIYICKLSDSVGSQKLVIIK